MSTPSSSGLATLRVSEFLSAVAAKSPAPGGGAVASVTGALGAALGRMVVSYSTGKKALAPYQPRLEQIAASLARLSDLLLTLSDEDAAAYSVVNELSRLPETDPRRRAQWAEAVSAAVGAPRATLGACCDMLRLLEELGPISNRHLRSDLAIAAELAESGAKAARWNVLVNLSLITDDRARSALRTEIDTLVTDASRRCAAIERSCEQE
jgi:formiminotetrahydrofolate cyclodeaminase